MQNAAITLRSLGSAFDDDPRGRAISHPLSSLLVEGCPCGADLSSAFGAPLLQGAALLACKNGICERNQYSLKYENTASLTSPFPPLREPTSAPSGHLLPKEGGREHTHYPPHKSLPRLGKVASEARRIGRWQYDNEREKASQAGDAEGRRHKNTFFLKKGTKKRSPCGLRFLISKTTH